MEIRPSSLLNRVKLQDAKSESAPPQEGEAKKSRESSKEKATVSGLRQVVNTNRDAGETLRKVSEKSGSEEEVTVAVREASTADVRDVEAASELADGIAENIKKNRDQAFTAQANQKIEKVSTLLNS